MLFTIFGYPGSTVLVTAIIALSIYIWIKWLLFNKFQREVYGGLGFGRAFISYIKALRKQQGRILFMNHYSKLTEHCHVKMLLELSGLKSYNLTDTWELHSCFFTQWNIIKANFMDYKGDRVIVKQNWHSTFIIAEKKGIFRLIRSKVFKLIMERAKVVMKEEQPWELNKLFHDFYSRVETNDFNPYGDKHWMTIFINRNSGKITHKIRRYYSLKQKEYADIYQLRLKDDLENLLNRMIIFNHEEFKNPNDHIKIEKDYWRQQLDWTIAALAGQVDDPCRFEELVSQISEDYLREKVMKENKVK